MLNQTKIGIFEGKKATYNLVILEVLFRNSPLTTWGIAKKIHENRNEAKDRYIAYSKTQIIYSVIARKGGRLDDLDNKGYILQKDSKWTLAFPKGLVVLIRKPEILGKINDYYLQKPPLAQGFKKSKQIVTPFGLKLQIDGKQLQTLVERMMKNLSNISMFSSMAKSMERLIQQGIDLDRIDNNVLAPLVIYGMQGYLSNLQKSATE